MTGRNQWRLLRWALRMLGCAAMVGALALGLRFMLDRGFMGEYSTAEQVRVSGLRLALWLTVMLALLMVAVPLTRRAMNTDRWPEALRWTALICWQGARMGLLVAGAAAVATLIWMGLQ